VTFANTGSALTTTNFSVLESGGKLIFKYGATVIASMGANGIFISANNIIAATWCVALKLARFVALFAAITVYCCVRI
jgi:hypothetical protein